MKGFLAAVAIALVAVVVHAGSADRAPDRPSESQLAAAPLPASTIESVPCALPRPVLPEVAPAAAESVAAAVPDLRTPAAEGRGLLISVQLREKYRPFQESLTSP